MSRRWIVVDTNIFCFTAYQAVGSWSAQERNRLYEGGEAQDFLSRMVNYCDEYGLVVDTEGLIIEEYEQKIPRDSFGYWAFRQMATRIPGKMDSFRHANPDWIDQLEGSHNLDKHDRRFLATALATPDKILVSEDTVFTGNESFLKVKGLGVYDAERANHQL